MDTEAGLTTTRPTLSRARARRLVDAAAREAEAISVAVTIVTVDESGVVKDMCRMDGAPLVSAQTALSKAYAAAAIGMPPDDFYAAIESDIAAVASFATRPAAAFDATHRLGVYAADQLGFAVGGVVTLPGKLPTTHP